MSTNAEERKLLREIDNLKKALPDMKKLETLEPELTQIREKKKAINKELDVVKKIMDEKNEKINSVKKDSEAQRNKKSEVRDAAEKFTVLIEKDNEELTKIYKTKDGCREDYYKALYEHEV
jgi:predicted  nucleic acid-binding Zn-ribbon protein